MTAPTPSTPARLLGLPFWTAGRSALFEHLRRAVAADELVELHSINAEISVQARDVPAYRELMLENPTNIMDGEGVRRLVALKYGRLYERISGSDLVGELAAVCAHEKWAVFLLGASEEVSAKAAARLTTELPALELARYSPPFEPTPTVSDEVTAEALERIAAARPRVLIACLGSPKQELWMKRHEDELRAAGVRVVMGAGGSLDFLAGKVRRAPRAVSQMGMEWAWRLALEPRARFARIARRLPRFAVLGLADALAHRLKRAA